MRTLESHSGPHRPWLSLMMASLTLACVADPVCVGRACGTLDAAHISVSAPNAPGGLSGVTIVVNGDTNTVNQDPCIAGGAAVSTCSVHGGRGTYSVEVRAPGYQTAIVKFTATGTPANCYHCDSVDTQLLSVVLQPIV
jgi:hypothetical protein